jgi:hypothetical protein
MRRLAAAIALRISAEARARRPLRRGRQLHAAGGRLDVGERDRAIRAGALGSRSGSGISAGGCAGEGGISGGTSAGGRSGGGW